MEHADHKLKLKLITLLVENARPCWDVDAVFIKSKSIILMWLLWLNFPIAKEEFVRSVCVKLSMWCPITANAEIKSAAPPQCSANKWLWWTKWYTNEIPATKVNQTGFENNDNKDSWGLPGGEWDIHNIIFIFSEILTPTPTKSFLSGK